MGYFWKSSTEGKERLWQAAPTVYTKDETPLKNNEIMPFSALRMNIENIIVNLSKSKDK